MQITHFWKKKKNNNDTIWFQAKGIYVNQAYKGVNKIKHRDHLSIHDEVARVAQLLSNRLITSDHRSNETNDYCRFDLAVNRMCQLRRSHDKDTWDHTPNRTHFRATLIIFGNARSRMCEGFCQQCTMLVPPTFIRRLWLVVSVSIFIFITCYL